MTPRSTFSATCISTTAAGWRSGTSTTTLADFYFTSNVGTNRLYLNKETIGSRTSPTGRRRRFDGWKTGVTMADVNGDGFVDIYVSGVDFLTMHGHNVLYINNGDGTFTTAPRSYGLDLRRFIYAGAVLRL